MRQLLSLPAFRLLWLGVAVSSFGDQFFTVALPWLVLQLSGSDAALGTVLMTAAIPTAFLTIVGGALSDRLPPARVLAMATLARGVLVGTVALLVITGTARLWHLYPLALAFGVLGALVSPAEAALVPRIARPGTLTTANGVLDGTSQVSAFAAPAPAGALIAAAGLGASFGVSAVASTLGAGFYAMVQRAIGRDRAADAATSAEADGRAPTDERGQPIDTLRLYLQSPALRGYLMLIAVLSLATTGPVAVGLPSLARVRFDGSVSLGIMLSASGAGAFAGTLLATTRPRLRSRGALILVVNAFIGLLLVLLAYAPTVTLASVAVAFMAAASSYVNLIATAKLQEAHVTVLGRLMGVVMLASVGLAPASYLLAGLASALEPSLMFVTAGLVVLGATARAAMLPALRRVD